MLVERITSITGQSALTFRSITTITVAMLALAATSSSRRGALAFHTRCSVAGLTRSAQNRSFPNAIGSATARRTNLPAVHLSAGLHSTSSTAHSFRYDIRLMSSVSHSEEDYNSLKVAELRDVLRERGLAISGTKAQLVERLGMSDGKSSTPKINTKRMPNNLVFEEEGPDEYSVVNDQKDDVKQSSRTAKTTFDPNVTPEVVPASSRSFKEDFQGTRVFVQGLPKEATWQDLKDHFGVAGEVVFASVSIDNRTGLSKQCGIVQYETSEMARAAIKRMRDHPMNGENLYVREDVQESRKGGNQLRDSKKGRGDRSKSMWTDDEYKVSLPSEWRRANDEGERGERADLSQEELNEIEGLVKKRDNERRRKNFNMSDTLREQLKDEFNVHLDDRLKMWWTGTSHGSVPGLVADIKGDGRWGKQKPWRQIPTTSENDAFVDSDVVNGLLQQRDKARKMKDFDTADALLQKAHDSPGGGLGLRVHDESRTWRIWTERPPPRNILDGNDDLSPADMCIQIVTENEPDKIDEMKSLVKKFPGREWNIYKKLKQRYGSN